METKIINGKALAAEHEEKLREVIEKLSGIPQVVSFFDPNDRPSKIFSHLKKDKAQTLGIVFDLIEINPSVTVEILASLVEGFNKDQETSGVMFQLPLPTHLKSKQQYLLNLIKSSKDIDGLTGRSFMPATIRGVLSILKDQKIDLESNIFAVVGSEGMMGKAMVKVLKEFGFKVSEIDKKISSSNLNDCRDADVVISCVGEKNLILPVHINEDAILIDVGLGDFDPECFKKSGAYTPEKGGVGPMTVISLMENIIDAYNNRGKK